MKFSVLVELEVTPEMNETLGSSAEKLDSLLLKPINMALKGYFKHHLQIVSITRVKEGSHVENRVSQ